jgi:RNA polymerase sigma factor (sigma-70 family)
MLEELSRGDLRDCIALVRLIAVSTWRTHPAACIDDLVSAGLLGLAEAGNNYDSSRGVAFGAFARIHIRGRMLDHIRDEARQAGIWRMVAYSQPVASSPSAEHVAVVNDDLHHVLDRMAGLDQRKRRIIEGAVDGDTSAELGRRMGISRSRVSRLRERARQFICGP